MIEVYGYVPAWGLPDISPYVTKLIVYLNLAKIPYEHKSQDLASLDTDAPFGKLPYIIDTENNKKRVGDSNSIIEYLQKTYGNPLDTDLSTHDHAIGIAFDRLICEHLYWSGVIQPRWRMDEGWETYIPYIVQGAEVGPELRAVLDNFRVRILDGFKGQGMGRRDADTVRTFYETDIDVLADYLGEKPYLLGDKPHVVDTGMYAMLRHLVDQPQKWQGTGYVESKKNLMRYLDTMRKISGV